MMKELTIKNKNGVLEQVILKTLNENYLDKIIDLQNKIYEYLDKKELFAKSEKSEFNDCLSNDGCILGLVTKSDELIAFGALVIPKERTFNLGYDLNLDSKLLNKIAHIESTVVHPNYRGNNIQKILCENLEEIGKNKGYSIFCATVSPINPYSLNTFLKLNYTIKLEKEKYGGINRYILSKDI